MNGGESSALLDETQQRLLLGGRDFGMIGVDQEAIVAGELRGTEIVERCRIADLDAALG